jgi:formylglycine-generating enzyme required for sulfatase activity
MALVLVATITALAGAAVTKTSDDEITNSLGMRLRLIPAGSFQMGSPETEPGRSPDEGPQHTVSFAEPFHIGVHEVTVGQYRSFVEAAGHREPADWSEQCQHPNRPVVQVSWNDAVAFCDWLSETEEGTYSLPSESQWECACRAGTTTAFNTGSSLSPEQANFDVEIDRGWSWDDAERHLRDVGRYAPNAFGLHDMHGNVSEWCQDWMHDSYEGAPSDGSAWEEPSGRYRVLRGGSWGHAPHICRSAARRKFHPMVGYTYLGFRVVRAP